MVWPVMRASIKIMNTHQSQPGVLVITRDALRTLPNI